MSEIREKNRIVIESVRLEDMSKRFLLSSLVCKVIGVYSAAMYLQNDEGRVFMIASKGGVVPIGVAVPDYEAIKGKISPKEGDTVRITCAMPDMILSFPLGEVYFKAPLYCHTVTSYKRKINLPALTSAAAIILSSDKKAGLAAASALAVGRDVPKEFENRYFIRARSAIESLIAGKDIEDSVRNLVGLGVGLTPSGDDFLVGYTYALYSSKEEKILPILLAAIRDNLSRTNAVSAEYLLAAAKNGYFEMIHSFCDGLSDCTAKAVTKATNNILSIGSSSGSDIASGFICGIVAAKNAGN